MRLNKRKVHHFFDSKRGVERLKEFLESKDCYPLHVALHLTTTCNHKCNFCSNSYSIRGEQPNCSLDTKDSIKFINEMKSIGMENVVISGGGEPLIYPGIEQVIRRINECGLNSSLYTNLDLNIKPHLLQQLSKQIPVWININTLDSNLYTRTRGKQAKLNRVIQNINRLKERGIPLNAIVVVRDDISYTLEETIDKLLRFGFQNITVSMAFDLPYKDGIISGERTLKNMENLRTKFPQENIRFLEPVEKAVLYSKKTFCKSPYFDVTIGADYWLYPCCMTAYNKYFRLLNLKNYNSFKEAWDSEERRKIFSKFTPSCEKCWFAPLNQIILKRWKTEK